MALRSVRAFSVEGVSYRPQSVSTVPKDTWKLPARRYILRFLTAHAPDGIFEAIGRDARYSFFVA